MGFNSILLPVFGMTTPERLLDAVELQHELESVPEVYKDTLEFQFLNLSCHTRILWLAVLVELQKLLRMPW